LKHWSLASNSSPYLLIPHKTTTPPTETYPPTYIPQSKHTHTLTAHPIPKSYDRHGMD
jgi:hypothetical protein